MSANLEGGGDLGPERDGNVLDAVGSALQIKGDHLCGGRIVYGAIETVSADAESKGTGDAGTNVFEVVLDGGWDCCWTRAD